MTDLVLFRTVWDLVATMVVLAGLSGTATALFVWLSLIEDGRRRVPLAFDLYRALAAGFGSWCAVGLAAAVEPFAMLAHGSTSAGRFEVYTAWILIAIGWSLAFCGFGVWRIQEFFGIHPWQRARRERTALA